MGVLTVVAQVLSVLILIALLTKKQYPIARKYLALLYDERFRLGFAVSFIAMVGSLTYSDIIGYTPCKLCWYQRIFMYPQVFLFTTAMIKKFTREIVTYSRVLSFVGAGIAFYHYYNQIWAQSPLPCSATGYSASCSAQFTLNFGYITIPMMAFSAFVLLFLLTFLKKDEVAEEKAT